MSEQHPTPGQPGPSGQPEQSRQPGQPPTYSGHQPPTTKRLTRSRDDRWLSGVCGGLARYAGIDANLVRLLVVLGTIFGLGSLVIAYIVAWILMPEE